MSNLSNNTTSLQSILAAVNALPEAGSGGSASLKTCSISGFSYYPVHYTTVENGEIVYACTQDGEITSADPITVLCNSVVFYDRFDLHYGTIETSGGVELVYETARQLAFKAPANAGAVGSFTVGDGPGIPDI